jgi:hypothetical protein
VHNNHPLSARVLHGASGSFAGEVAVWTTRNATEIVLHDSRASAAAAAGGGGASTTTKLRPGGSVALSRRLVAVPVREDLVVRVRVDLVGDAERFEFEGTLGHLDNRRTFCRGRYMMQVTRPGRTCTATSGDADRSNCWCELV